MDNNGNYRIGRFAGIKDFTHGLGLSIGFLLLFSLPSYSLDSNSLPTGYNAVSGNVSFNQSGNTLNVNSASNSSIVNYNSFSVGSNASVNFNLPGSSAAILNRVTGGITSEIYGNINSNGHVFIVNPSGVIFGASSQVNVGSLTASTLDIENEDFLLGKYSLSRGNSNSAVINQGNIHATGSINLIGSAINNEGNLVAPNINLVVGEQVTLNIADGISASVQVDKALKQKVDDINDAIKNTGNIQGGDVRLKTDLETAFYNTLVNNEGIIQASKISSNNGVVELIGHTVDRQGVVVNSGTINGNKVMVTGDKTGLIAQSEIVGNEVLIGGDYQGKNPEIINSQVTYVDKDSSINTIGEDSKVVVWADDTTRFYGSVNAPAGFVEVSGKNILDFQGKVIADTLLLDPTNLEIIADTDFPAGETELKNPFSPVSGDISYIKSSVLQSAFNNGKVNISTSSTGNGAGDITFAEGLAFTNVRGTFTADRDINLGAGTSFTQHSSAVPIQFIAGRNVNLDGNTFILADFRFGQVTDGIENTAVGRSSHRLLFAANSSSVDQNGTFHELSSGGSTVYTNKLYDGQETPNPFLGSVGFVSDWNRTSSYSPWVEPTIMGTYTRNSTNRPQGDIHLNLLASGGNSSLAFFQPTIVTPNTNAVINMGSSTALFTPYINNKTLNLSLITNNNTPLRLTGFGGGNINVGDVKFNGVDNTLQVKSARNDGWLWQSGSIGSEQPLHLTFVDYFNVRGSSFYGTPLHIDYVGSTAPIHFPFSGGFGLTFSSYGPGEAVIDLPVSSMSNNITINVEGSKLSLLKPITTTKTLTINAPNALIDIQGNLTASQNTSIVSKSISQSLSSILTASTLFLNNESVSLVGANKITNLGNSTIKNSLTLNNNKSLNINGPLTVTDANLKISSTDSILLKSGISGAASSSFNATNTINLPVGASISSTGVKDTVISITHGDFINNGTIGSNTSKTLIASAGNLTNSSTGIIQGTNTNINVEGDLINNGIIGGTNSLANIQISGNGILNNTTGTIEGGSVLINSSLNADIHGTVKSNNGDITILASGNNDSDINFIDANINSANNLLSIANNDISIDPTSITTAGDAVFVVDNANPFSIGSGTFSIDASSSINARGRILLYTASPEHNFINPNANIQSGLGGTFNQSTFATSASGPYSSNQFWGAYYGLSSDPAIKGKGIVGYADLAHHYFKYGNLLPEMNGVFYKLALSSIPIPPKVILPPIINPFAGMMDNSGGLTNSLLNYDNTKAPDIVTKKFFKFIYKVDKNKDGIFSKNDVVFEYMSSEDVSTLNLTDIVPEILKSEIRTGGVFDLKVLIMDLSTGNRQEQYKRLELPELRGKLHSS